MNGGQSRLLKIGDRVSWGAAKTDFGTVTGTDWAGVKIAWEDGSTDRILHNDMGQVQLAPPKLA